MLRQARQLRSKLMGQNGSRSALIHTRSDNLALAAHWSLTSRDLTLPASLAWQSACIFAGVRDPTSSCESEVAIRDQGGIQNCREGR